MFELLGLIDRLLSLAEFAIALGVILYMIRQAAHARWLYHPVISAIVNISDACCAPFRRLLRKANVPSSPLDFSPMAAVMAIELGRTVLRWL